MNAKFGELMPYVADSDNQWLREIKEQVRAETPKHRASVLWDSDRFGVPWFRVHCNSCGSIVVGVDKAFLGVQAREHEAQG